MGIYLSTPNKEKVTLEGSISTVSFAASCMQGWRTSMEDAHISKLNLIEGGVHLFAVFDGHGGKDVSTFCSQVFGEYLKDNENFKAEKIELALKETFLRIDKELLEKEAIDQGLQGGCTANVVLIYKNTIYVANAGDSRAILSLKNSSSSLEELSRDHKPDLDSEKERILKAGGFIQDGRVNANLNLSRALGDLEYKKDQTRSPEEQVISYEPEIKSRQIDENCDFMLMGCDGVFEMLSNEALLDFIKKELKNQNSLKNAVENLLDQIIAPNTLNGVGCDNMSAIIIQFNNTKN